MKKICILLNGPIKNDSRVIKIIRTFSVNALIDLFYVDGEPSDHELFNNNVKLHSYPSPKGFINKLLKHSLFFLEFSFYIKEVLKKDEKYDIIYSNDLPTLYPASKIKAKAGKMLVYDSHEIYVATLNQFFPSKTSLLKRIVFDLLLFVMQRTGGLAEKLLTARADIFITVNHSCAEYFKKKYQIEEVKVLVNAPHLLPPPKPAVSFRELYHWSESAKIFIYQGVLTYGKGLEVLVEAMTMVPDSIKLVIMGEGTLKEILLKKVQKLKLDSKISFHPKVPSSSLAGFTVAADFGINFLENINLSKRYASNNKMFEYIHAGIPLLSSNSIENIKIHNEFNIGFISEMNPVNIARMMVKLATSDEISVFKANCREASKKYNWDNQARILTDLII